ncbi:hypothetical protein Tco_0701564 [Tanacetum coccineum]
MVPATAPLIGFSGEIIWPLGQLTTGILRDELVVDGEFGAEAVVEGKELFLGEDAIKAIPNMGFNLVNVEGFLYLEIEVVCVEFGCHFDVELECEFTLSSLDVLQGFSFFLQIGFTLILATLNGLDVCLLGDVIGEDDCDDDG